MYRCMYACKGRADIQRLCVRGGRQAPRHTNEVRCCTFGRLGYGRGGLRGDVVRRLIGPVHIITLATKPLTENVEVTIYDDLRADHRHPQLERPLCEVKGALGGVSGRGGVRRTYGRRVRSKVSCIFELRSFLNLSLVRWSVARPCVGA